ncbi:ScbA/BarX family gamma-butyrolactone biosynthesis protein [Streptomyces yerevanensis]|uniref:ScbA/BarX family gamma-butyrolactone biosynthesis protein n=1 Tax=Streptomyces yerevanensis TaxID=66378 RepID=UPI0005267D22|nr:ScbA/BarX family gamma-butyrolactone biosynthesis protein [Streptomyces yerevanensis]
MTSLHTHVPAPAVPGLTTTVPKEYVHRASLAEVFLTRCARQSENHFSLSGQWPRAHTFFQAADGSRHDPLLTAETFRQAGLFLAHAELGVPLGYHFVMWDLWFSTELDQLHIGSTPTDIELSAVCTDITFRGGRATGFRMELSIRRGGTVVAVGGGRFTCISPAVYRRLRGSRLGCDLSSRRGLPRPTMPPATVGRDRPEDVVLSPTEQPNRWLLKPDPDHPVLFDHEGDHYPGMVLLEAARQATCGLMRPYTITPSAISTVFHRYAEFDEACIIEATPTASQERDLAAIEVTGHQDGRQVFTSLLTGSLHCP